MNVLIEFNIPEDRCELLRVVHAGDYLASLYDFREWLRALNKHGHPYANADEAVGAIYAEYCQRISGFDEQQQQ